MQVALAVPLRQIFDYFPPEDVSIDEIYPGARVEVPFGRSRKVGVVVARQDQSDVPASKLKRAYSVLDEQPCLDEEQIRLLNWATDYYQHPIGEVIAAALPRKLRDGAPLSGDETVWLCSANAPAEAESLLKRAPRQAELWQVLAANADGMNREELNALPFDSRAALRALGERGWIDTKIRRLKSVLDTSDIVESPHELNPEQQIAVTALCQQDDFCCTLLHGVTGSGKTEVYFHHIAHTLARGKQVLVLVPEISLTPQLLARFQRRFDAPIALMHSALTDTERLNNWRAIREGQARIIIGTRSAVFVPLTNPGLIVIDEEHDGSLKQHEGFRYSARDLAVVRARMCDIPIVLGSATPSLESLHNVHEKRYELLRLTVRAGNANPPQVDLIDLSTEPSHQGLSTRAVTMADAHLKAGGQVLFFLNRRGYSPAWYCNECAWIADCPDCDAHLTYHQDSHSLRCHHCARLQPVPNECPSCESELKPVGQGTERIEEHVAGLFPGYPVARMDRDVVRSRPQLEAFLDKVNSGEVKVLIGTQMLAKGHHFPNVTLVVILNADQGLFGVDFRSTEKLAQLIVQVSGRAGRAQKPGHVLIQTSMPDHPLLQHLVHEGYEAFATAALEERKVTQWPPFSYLALVRAHSKSQQPTMDFLRAAHHYVRDEAKRLGIELYGPVTAPMARRGGKIHGQLLIQARQRGAMNHVLSGLSRFLYESPPVQGVRWSLDVDPQELF
ncbi:MAG: primosomal protein N' [Gammaproteobacteria bacterium]